jgi:hypothetical protein
MSTKPPSSKTHGDFVFEPLETPQKDRIESTFLIDLRRPKRPSERRRYRRVSVALPARMSTVEPEYELESGDPYFRASEAVCLNVSRGGALVRAEEGVESGKRLLLELDLADGRQAELMGRVVWAKRSQHATDTDGETHLGIEWIQGGQDTLSQHLAL